MTVDTKEILIDEFLEYASLEEQKSDELIKRIEKYLVKSIDSELILALNVLNTLNADNNQQTFEECCAIAAPIFKQLEDTNPWARVELHSISSVIGYIPSVKTTLEFFNEAKDLLTDEDESDNKQFRKNYLSLQYNLTYRLLRAKFIESDVDILKVDELFESCFEYVFSRAKKNNSPLQYVLQIRYGVYECDAEAAKDAMIELKKLGDRKIYKTTRDEIAEYLSYMRTPLAAPLSYISIGYQLRKERLEKDISTLHIAGGLGTDQSTVAAIERGDDGISIDRLQVLASLVGVDVGFFFGNKNAKIKDADPFLLSVIAATKHMTDEDKQHILDFIALHSKYKYPNHGKPKKKATKNEQPREE
ncbi:MAG: helix-turn-helix domain-containing protein [Defluviitaleaceae bacterium]|nr:helix-turn-helix domain-containing protein [Defluviitaleaceae bacterium]